MRRVLIVEPIPPKISSSGKVPLNRIVENINRPVPLKDELAFGLLARMARLNILHSVDELLQAILTLPRWPANLPPLEKLASVFGMTPMSFIQGHILPPATGYLGARSFLKNTTKKALKFMHARVKTPAEFLRWCPTCANEDFVSHGLSYWRRSHQLPGLDWCHLHQAPLAQVAASLVMSEPHLLSDVSTPCISHEDLEHELAYPAIQCLQHILLAWVNAQPDLPVVALKRAIWGYGWLSMRGKMYIDKTPFPPSSLDARMREAFPTSWLDRHLARHREKILLGKYTFFHSALGTWDMNGIYLEPRLDHAVLLVCAFSEAGTGLQRVTASIKRYMRATGKQRTLTTPSFMYAKDKETFYSPGMGVLWAPPKLIEEARITMRQYKHSFCHEEDEERREIFTMFS